MKRVNPFLILLFLAFLSFKKKNDYLPESFVNDATKESLTRQGYQERIYALVGKKFPKEQVRSLLGENVVLNNKPTLINLWYTSCKPCVAEIPFLNEIRKEYKDRVNFIAITFERKEVVEKFLKKRSFDFLHIVDSKKFLDDLGVRLYPKNIFIDRSSIVTEVKGALILNQSDTESKKEAFKKALEKLL